MNFVEKRLWGSAGGKKNIAKKLVSMIPQHSVYVEPFAGGAAVFYTKSKQSSQKEILSDLDPDVAFAFKFVRDCTDSDIEKLKKLNWQCSKDNVANVCKLQPKNDLQRFFKFAFLRWAGYFGDSRVDDNKGLRRGINPLRVGQTCKYPFKMLTVRERLKGVVVHHASYDAVIRKYDSNNTFFFFDPPFPELRQGVFEERNFDTKKFVDTLKTIKGSFLVTYTKEKSDIFSSFKTKQIKYRFPRDGRIVGITLVSNYDIPVRKSIDPIDLLFLFLD